MAHTIGGRSLYRPGTILAVEPNSALAATVDGVVRISDLHDMIGPIEPERLQPGQRLGHDLETDVEALESRVADVEHIVSRPARHSDLLS